MFLLDLACYMKASWRKSEGKGVAFGGFSSFFFDNYLGKYKFNVGPETGQ